MSLSEQVLGGKSGKYQGKVISMQGNTDMDRVIPAQGLGPETPCADVFEPSGSEAGGKGGGGQTPASAVMGAWGLQISKAPGSPS